MSSVWNMIESDPVKAEQMKRKSDMVVIIAGTVQKNAWSKPRAAEIMGVDPFRMKALLSGDTSRFSEEELNGAIERVRNAGHGVWEFPAR